MSQNKDRAPHATPTFSKHYWKEAAKEFTDTKKLCIAALIVALAVVLKPFKIPISPSMQIGVSFIASAIGGFVLGPLLSFVRGAVSDVVGWLIFPNGGFNPAYTLSESLGAMIYSLFLWRKHLSIPRVISMRFVINLGVNALLGSYWTFLYFNSKGSGYPVFLATSLAKNLLMLPVEVIVTVVLLNAIAKPLYDMKLVPHQRHLHVSLAAWIVMGVLIAGVIALAVIAMTSPEGAIETWIEEALLTVKNFFRTNLFGLEPAKK